MSEGAILAEYELICAIVDFGKGSKVIHLAKQFGISGGTVMLGKGTIKSKLLEFLAITDVRKEVVLMVARKDTALEVAEHLEERLQFSKPHHGIAFTIPVNTVIGNRKVVMSETKENKGADPVTYHCITTIVEKGKAEEVIEAARAAGSKGATIINARGSGIEKLFSMEIEPEKEIVLILSEVALTDAIVASIREKLHIDEPGHGIIFVQDVNRTYGLYNGPH